MKISFDLLKKISENDDTFLIDVLNSFQGDNIHEKFLNILKCWERDVSYDINLVVESSLVKVMVSHIINECGRVSSDDILIGDDIKFFLNFPEKFDNKSDSMFPYGVIKKIKKGDVEINLGEYLENIVDVLPAKMYNQVLSVVKDPKNKKVNFSNRMLKNLSINFLSYDPFIFLKNLFHPFNDDYFRDIIYYLSKRIDSSFLKESTIFDIEYFIDKMNEENVNQEEVQNLG